MRYHWERVKEWYDDNFRSRFSGEAVFVLLVLVGLIAFGSWWTWKYYGNPNLPVALAEVADGFSSQKITTIRELHQMGVRFTDWRRDDERKLSCSVTITRPLPAKLSLFVQLCNRDQTLEQEELILPPLSVGETKRITIDAPTYLSGWVPSGRVDHVKLVPGWVIDFHDAVRDGYVHANIRARGMSRVEVDLDSTYTNRLVLVVPAGTLFVPSAKKQSLLAVKQARLHVISGRSLARHNQIDVVCTDMNLDPPDQADTLTVRSLQPTDPGGADLLQLVALAEFRELDFPTNQFPVWTITNNPAPRDFKSISISSGFLGASWSSSSSVDKERLASMQELFLKAGISPLKYRAFTETK
jgi:hypothetical protein